MQSPTRSPSIRTVAHQIHSRAQTSYFPPVNSPAKSIPHHHPSNFSTHSVPTNCKTSSPSVGCLKNGNRSVSSPRQSIQPTNAGSHNRNPYRPAMPTRPSLKQSVIPLSYQSDAKAWRVQASTSRATSSLYDVTEPARRRPSFKIDLPPRPAPKELASMTSSKGTPYPESVEIGTDTFASSRSFGTAVTTLNHSRQPVQFQEPFAERDYIILAASPHESGFFDALPDIVGLGYSLNRMRAPTPWIREAAEDAEWLGNPEMKDSQSIRCLGIA